MAGPSGNLRQGRFALLIRLSSKLTALISICRKSVTEHWGFTLRLFLSGFVLNDIPVLYENSVLNANNIGCDPVHHRSKPRKAPVCDNEVSFGNHQTSFIMQSGWKRLDQVEKAFTARLDVCTVLDVVRRPESFRGRIIALVEECVERFQDEGLVLFGRSLRHLDSFHTSEI